MDRGAAPPPSVLTAAAAAAREAAPRRTVCDVVWCVCVVASAAARL